MDEMFNIKWTEVNSLNNNNEYGSIKMVSEKTIFNDHYFIHQSKDTMNNDSYVICINGKLIPNIFYSEQEAINKAEEDYKNRIQTLSKCNISIIDNNNNNKYIYNFKCVFWMVYAILMTILYLFDIK